MKRTFYWVYILYCENNTYYTGYTVDLIRRYQSHVSGMSKSKYTRSFKPKYIAQCWKVNGNRALAMKIERYIKKLSRLEKENIIKSPTILSQDIRIEIVDNKLILPITSD